MAEIACNYSKPGDYTLNIGTMP